MRQSDKCVLMCLGQDGACSKLPIFLLVIRLELKSLSSKTTKRQKILNNERRIPFTLPSEPRHLKTVSKILELSGK
ncbi:MAG: hypothetical protein ACI9QV_000888 [Methylophagaceae bacterium]|jgi:hypothetical protein